MSVGDHVLRQFVRACLVEAAVAIDHAVASGLALMIKDEGELQKVVLYGPDQLMDAIVDRRQADIDATVRSIFASAAHRAAPHCGDDVRRVELSAARHGYGPMLYDILMSQGAWIMPDRQDVSPSASMLWQRYGARSDVEFRPLDPSCRTFTRQQDPRGAYLDRACRLRNPLDLTSLVARHSEAMKRFEDLVDSGEVKTAMTYEKFMARAGMVYASRML